MKHYYLAILLFCVLSHSCGCPFSTFVKYDSISVHSTNSYTPIPDVILHNYTKHLNGEWGRACCHILQDFGSWNNVRVNKENIKICKSGEYLEFELYTFNEKEEKAYFISNSDYYMDNSSPLYIELKERLDFGDSLSIVEYNLPYKGDTIRIDIKLPNYPREDKRGITGDGSCVPAVASEQSSSTSDHLF